MSEQYIDNSTVFVNNSSLSVDSIMQLSEEFEKDARRYNRAFTEEQEVGTK